ncbi:pyrroline-5-carboxylate reductase [Lentilactobacillus sp. SPB1-3]|uniref:Pyrroline-5-carboxylate reductase n=1 Tax=Lentilactobacillus terminaliae TaxID=3003483 RepID=A0ACD5DGH7_9LACO|nr:pyrroline-5-carboxylate reductase [Lentilactobacillus sp. SPB1-3]MCZ0976861.1 pyrroline-5-carboxylate reductase [Lentilactobacillus sp. SPB1-3]
MKIGFIGVGAMARAIIDGLLKTNVVAPGDILIHANHPDRYEPYAKENGLVACATNSELTSKSDVVVIGVVPAVVQPVLQEISDSLTNTQPIISMASGITINRLEELTDKSQPILRILPNVNSAYKAGMTAVASNEFLKGETLDDLLKIMRAIGEVLELPESQFANFSAISGSAVAYIDFFIDALSRAGVKYGFDKATATKIAAQTTLGSAQALIESGETPAEIIDKVCSPGGDTIAGILAMEQAGLLNAVVKGIDATIEKSTGNN